ALYTGLPEHAQFDGGDIPIICVHWDKELVDAAIYYWVDLSANRWIKEERENSFCQVAAKVHGRNPCFYQVDLLAMFHHSSSFRKYARAVSTGYFSSYS
ncbi:hypothetical protein ARMGADRAFT_1020215, partial [Armillaria gallica]